MKCLLPLTALAILVCTAAEAAAPKIPVLAPRPQNLPCAEIDAPDKVPEHTLVVASTATVGTGYGWWVLGPRGFESYAALNGRAKIVFTGPPGKYAVMLMIVLEGGGIEQSQKEIVIEPVTPPEPPEPVENPYRPDPELQTQTGPVTALRLSRADASRLAVLFHELSNDLNTSAKAASAIRDDPFRSCQSFADEMARRGVPMGLRGKYPGLGAAVKGLFETVLGRAEGPLDRPKAARLCETLAWAVWETGVRG